MHPSSHPSLKQIQQSFSIRMMKSFRTRTHLKLHPCTHLTIHLEYKYFSLAHKPEKAQRVCVGHCTWNSSKQFHQSCFCNNLQIYFNSFTWPQSCRHRARLFRSVGTRVRRGPLVRWQMTGPGFHSMRQLTAGLQETHRHPVYGVTNHSAKPVRLQSGLMSQSTYPCLIKDLFIISFCLSQHKEIYTI